MSTRKTKAIIAKYGPKAVGLALNAEALVSSRKAAEKALDIFCTPRNGRVRPHQKKFLDQFERKVLLLDELEIATYEHVGSGPKILLCHGWESNGFRWRKLFARLKENDFHVIMMDAPSHGESGGEKFNALLYADMINVVGKHYRPEVICGHSVGGMASIIYLYKAKPEFMKKAIILASPDRLSDITDNYFSIIGGSSRLRKAYEKLFPEKFGKDMSYYSAAKFAEEIDIPALIVHDRDDNINKYVEGQRIHEAWKGSELYTTTNLGHSLQSPEVFDKVDEFLL